MIGTENWGLVAIGGGAALASNILYQLGGIGNKWLRRFVAPVILAVAANGIAVTVGTWAWQLTLILPCLIVGFSLGYGASTTVEKILRRSIYAAGVLTACFCGLWATGFTISGWVVFGLACLTGITSVALGVLNPFNSARAEEFLVCQVLTLYIPFWGMVR